jgi:hypothetical protein
VNINRSIDRDKSENPKKPKRVESNENLNLNNFMKVKIIFKYL